MTRYTKKSKIPPKILWPALLVSVVCAMAFAPSMSDQLTNWDDDGFVTNNLAIRSLAPENIGHMFTDTHYRGNYYPLTQLSYAVEYHFFQTSPEVYHFDNILLHTVNSVLVLGLIFLISGKVEVALIAALLFAVHPLRVESVTWVSERKDVLYALFFISSLISYVLYLKKPKELKFYLLALGLFLLSVLSKGMAVSLPLALILLDFLKGRKITRRALIDKIPFFAISVIFGYVAVHAQKASGSVEGLAGFSIVNKLLYASYALVFYLEKTVLPFKLSAIYPYPDSISPLYPLAIICLALCVAYSLKRTKKIFFGTAFFFFTIVFVLQILAVGKFIAADRYTYIPLIGVFYLYGEGFSAWVAWRRKRGHRNLGLYYLALGLLIASFAKLTYERTQVWHDSYTLMSDVLKQYPNSVDARINRALVTDDGNAAIADYTVAIEHDPSRTVAYNNRGLLHYNRGEFAKAIQDYDAGIRGDPSYSNLYFNRMLYHYYYKKDYPKAWADMRSAEALGYRVGESLQLEIENSNKR